MKTIDYLETIKKTNDITDYRIAQLLDTSQSTVSKYRKGIRFFDDEMAIKVAEILQINPSIILADIHAERAKIRKTKKVWQGIAESLRATAAAVFVTAIISLAVSNGAVNSMAYEMGNTHSLHIMLNRLLRE